MRRIAKTDATQSTIVRALLDAGCSWQPLYPLHGGEPDGIAGHDGVNTLLEIKSSETQRKRKGPTADKQKAWAQRWRGGPVHVVVTPEEALRAVGLLP